MPSIKVGYIFKPDHDEIHYLKRGAKGDMRMKYCNNFTTNFNDAEVGSNVEKAKDFIVKLVSKFPRDDEYKWTPVLVNADSKTYQRCTFGSWRDESIRVPFVD